MTTGKITFSATAYDGDAVFDITVAKNDVKAKATFYGDAKAFLVFGKQLIDFPMASSDRVIFEIPPPVNGYGQPLTGYDSFLLEAYCFSEHGHSALRVIIDNNAEMPYRQRVEFSLRAEAASLNKLGSMLVNWQTTEDSEIIWQAQTS